MSYIQYWDVNNTHGCAMPQKLWVNNFDWINYTSQCNEDFLKNESYHGYFLEVDVQYLGKLQELYNNLPFLQKGFKIEKIENMKYKNSSKKKSKNWFCLDE